MKDMHSIESFAETNPEVSESLLFILSSTGSTFNKSIFKTKLSHFFVQSVQELVLEFKIVIADTRKLRV